VQSNAYCTYQFKGNTFFAREKQFDMSMPGWWKGIFTYTDEKLSMIYVEAINQGLLAQNRSYKWTRVTDYGQKKVQVVNYTYALNEEGLTLGKTSYRLLEQMNGPEEYVYFYNENNWVENSTANPYAFSIEQIDDKQLVKVANYLGVGYQNAVEERKPGSHKITFRQTRNEGNRTNEVYGYFTKDFSPGLYHFAVYTDAYSVFMPDNLPPVPPNHARVVIIRTELGKSESLYDYTDASL
jgi:hypothetical protein